VPRHGCGTSSRSSSSRPATPNRSVTGQGCPKVIIVEWMRRFRLDLCLTRCSRKRACSHSHRTLGSASQIAGTRSRCESTARTCASIVSVLHANGARPLTFCASAIDTSQPSRSKLSCTNRAPVIDSITPRTARRTARSARPGRAAHRRRAARPSARRPHPLVDQADVEPLATELQSSVQHENGPPRARSSVNTRSVSPGRPSLTAVRAKHEPRPDDLDEECSGKGCGARLAERARRRDPNRQAALPRQSATTQRLV
jgi:hypothetical protein